MVGRWKHAVTASLFGAVALLALSTLHIQRTSHRIELEEEDGVQGSVLRQGMKVLAQIEEREEQEEKVLAPKLHKDTRAQPMRKFAASGQPQAPPLLQQPSAKPAPTEFSYRPLTGLSGQIVQRESLHNEKAEKRFNALGLKRVEGFGRLDGMGDKNIPFSVAFSDTPAKPAVSLLKRAEEAAETRKKKWAMLQAAKQKALQAAEKEQEAAAKAKGAAVKGAKEAKESSKQGEKKTGHGGSKAAVGAWGVFVDQASGRPYYFNAKTGQSSWRFPSLSILQEADKDEDDKKEEGAEEEEEKEDPYDADRETSTFSRGKKVYDKKTGVLVSHWPLDIRRILPLPSFDSSARIQNQRNAHRYERGANTEQAGVPGKLLRMGVNTDGGWLDLPHLKNENPYHKLEHSGVEHDQFYGQEAIPYPGWDRTQWDYDKKQARRSFFDPYETDDDDHRLQKAGVRIYTDMPELPGFGKHERQHRNYVDGFADNMHTVDGTHHDYIPDAPDAAPLHIFLKDSFNEGKKALKHLGDAIGGHGMWNEHPRA